MSKVLFISNGHGEDLISLRIISDYRSLNKDDQIYVLPMIGKGKVFKEQNLEIIGPQKETPSGGFVKNFVPLMKDLFSGLLFLHFKQIRNASKNKYDLVVCVGDFLPLILSYLFIRYKKIVLVSTAKSDLFEPHFAIERWFFKKANANVFVRDSITADNLIARGINASYVGNVMMDGFKVKRLPKNDKDKFIVGILPGSRLEAYSNYILIKQVIFCLPNDWNYKVAVAGNMDKSKFLIENSQVEIVDFEKLIKTADIVIGLAGTANEQVIGFGIPLFTFKGFGPQTTKKRFTDQKKLLGDLSVYIDSQDSEIISKVIKQKVKDVEFIQRVKVEGFNVMGKSGASLSIAKELVAILKC